MGSDRTGQRWTAATAAVRCWQRATLRAAAGGALAVGLAAASAQPVALEGTGLVGLVREALGADPAVSAAAAQARAAEQRVFQAKAAFGPTATLTGNYSTSNYYEDPDSGRRLHSDQTTLQVTMPILRGTLLPALDAAQAQLLQARAALTQAQSEAAQRIVESAFEVLKARDVLAFVQAQQVASGEQLRSARRAFEVGTAPVTDMRDAEARSDAVAAQVLAAQADLAMRRQVLAELAGREAPGLLGRGLDGSALPALQPDAVATWLDEAYATNPQIQQSRLALEAAEQEVRKATLGHTPTIDLNYSWNKSADNGTVTAAFGRSGTNNTLGVTITFPLFASGATESKVREAVALRDKARADVDSARRTVALAVRQAYSAAVSAVAQARGLEAAVRSQETALRANLRSYQVGVKVNTEVLDAQTRLFEARRDLSRARYEAWNGFVKLRSQTGQLGDPDLARIDALLVDVPPLQLITPRTGAQ